MRRPLIPALFAVALLTSLPALADEPNNKNCPPGGWFCSDANVDTPQEPADDDNNATNDDDNKPTLPKAQPPDEEEMPSVDPDRGSVHKPHVVVVEEPGGYATPPPNVVIVTQSRPRPRYIPPPQMPPPPVARPQRLFTKWGFNLRVEGAAMGDGASVDAGIGGLGMSLRYRPVPAFGFDLGVDVIGGKDYNGFSRIETPVSLNAMIFVNPRSRVQFYLMGGVNYSHAKVKSDSFSPLLAQSEDGEFTSEYSYLGGHGGAGLEFRLSRHVALNIDALGFARHRTDDGRRPEFVDWETGQTTKNSGGGLFRGGLTFWW